MCKLVLVVQFVCVSKGSLLTLCIFNDLYFHESQEYLFSVVTTVRPDQGRQSGGRWWEGFDMLLGETFTGHIYLWYFVVESYHRGWLSATCSLHGPACQFKLDPGWQEKHWVRKRRHTKTGFWEVWLRGRRCEVGPRIRGHRRENQLMERERKRQKNRDGK